MKKKKGPWIVTDTTVVYKNPWIQVIEDKVVQPDKKEGIFGVVHMKSGVSVLALDENGYVYLTKQYQYALEKKSLEAINGGIDKDETKLDAAKRELQEEAGITAKEWIDFGFIDPFTSVVSSVNYMFLARNLQFVANNPEGTEQIEIIKVPLEEAIQMVMDNTITHGATTTLLLKVKKHLGI